MATLAVILISFGILVTIIAMIFGFIQTSKYGNKPSDTTTNVETAVFAISLLDISIFRHAWTTLKETWTLTGIAIKERRSPERRIVIAFLIGVSLIAVGLNYLPE